MKDLTTCLAKNTKSIKAQQRKEIIALRDSLINDMSPEQAAARAVELYAEQQDVEFKANAKLVEEAGGEPLVSPFIAVSNIKKDLDKAEAKRVAEEKKAEEKRVAEEKKKAEAAKKQQTRISKMKETVKERFEKARAKAAKTAAKKAREARTAKVRYNPKWWDPGEKSDEYKLRRWYGKQDETSDPADAVRLGYNVIPEAAEFFNDPKLSAKQAFLKVLDLLDDDNPTKILGMRIFDNIPDETRVFTYEKGDAMPANMLYGLNKGTKSAYGVHWQGMYWDNLNPVIVLRGVSFNATGLSDATIVHEFMHAATVELIRVARAARKKGKAEYEKIPKDARDAYENMVRLHDKVTHHPHFKKMMSEGGQQQMKSVEEFITWGLTNPTAKMLLQQIRLGTKLQKKSAWSKFTETMMNILGLKGGEERNAYLALTEALDHMLESDWRRDKQISKDLTQFGTGTWYKPVQVEMPDTEPPSDSQKTELNQLMNQLTQLQSSGTALRVTSFEVGTAVGTEAYGLQLTADEFAADTSINGTSSDDYVINDGSVGDIFQSIFDLTKEDSNLGLTVDLAIRQAAIHVQETGNAIAAEKIAKEIFNTMADDASAAYGMAQEILADLDYNNLEITVVRPDSNFEMYSDDQMLKMLPVDFADKDAFVMNPEPWMPVAAAKLKVTRPGIWEDYLDFLKSAKETDDVNFYTYLANNVGAEKASELLNESGIKAMVSADRTNYVLFDPVKTEAIVQAAKQNTYDSKEYMELRTNTKASLTPADEKVVAENTSKVLDIESLVADWQVRGDLTDAEMQAMTSISVMLSRSLNMLTDGLDPSAYTVSMRRQVRDIDVALRHDQKRMQQKKTPSGKGESVKNEKFRLPFRRIKRAMLLSKVANLQTFNPLQKRLHDALMAAAVGDVKLAQQRMNTLFADLDTRKVFYDNIHVVNKDENGNLINLSTPDSLGMQVLVNKKIAESSAEMVGAMTASEMMVDKNVSDRMSMGDGKRFVDNSAGNGQATVTQEDVAQAVAESEGVYEGEVSIPKSASFWNKALSLPNAVRYQSEVTAEVMRRYFPDLTDAQLDKFITMVNGTQNIREAIVQLSDQMQNDTMGAAIAEGLLQSDLKAIKQETPAGITSFLAGATTDLSMALSDTDAAFLKSLAKVLNKQGGEPYQIWQLKNLADTQQDGPSINFAAELDSVMQDALSAGLLSEGQFIDNSVLMNEDLAPSMLPTPDAEMVDIPDNHVASKLLKAVPEFKDDLKLARDAESLNKVSAAAKVKYAQQINDYNNAQSSIFEKIPVNSTVVHDGKSLHYVQTLETVQAEFEYEQAQFEYDMDIQAQEMRIDIQAGRRAKDAKKRMDVQYSILNDAEPAPENNAEIDDAAVKAAVDKIIPVDKTGLTLKQKLARFSKEFFSKEYRQNLRKRLYQYWVSDVASIEWLDVKDAIKEGVARNFGMKSSTVLSMQAKNAHVSASIPIHFHGIYLENGVIKIDESQRGLVRILEDVQKLGKETMRLYEAYVVVKRAERLMGEGKENFVLDSEIQAIKDKVTSNKALHALFERTHTEYQALNRQVLQVAIDAGYINEQDAFGGFVIKKNIYNDEGDLIAQEEITDAKNTAFATDLDAEYVMEQVANEEQDPNISYEVEERAGWFHDDYVPFNRIDETMEKSDAGRRQGRLVADVKKGVIKLKGGVGQIPVVENMANNIAFMISGSLKTIAMKRIVEQAENLALESIEVDGQADLIKPAMAREIMKEMGIELNELSLTDQQRWIRMLSQAGPQDPNSVVLYENGRPTYYRVTDPLLLEAMKSVGVKETKGWLEKLGFITRILTKSITVMPGFLIRNFVRESQNTYVIDTKNSLNPLKHIGKAFANLKRIASEPYSKIMQEMMAAGAVSYDNYFDVRPEGVRKTLNRMGVSGSERKTIVNSLQSAWKMYMRMAIASEHANRFSVRETYINARVKELGGADAVSEAQMQEIVAEANNRALDVLNFSRRGAGIGADLAIAVLPFINPRIQGLDRLVRGAKEDKKNFLTKMGMMSMAAFAMALYNWEENEEEMAALKDTDKDLFYHFWIPMNGKKEHWRIPKGFEIGQLAGSFPERIVEQISNPNAEPVEKTMRRFLAMTFGIQAPQTIKPMLEVANNYDSFRQRPILNFGMQFKPDHMQYDVYTNLVARDMAQAMPDWDWIPSGLKSPKYLDHMIKGYLGPVGAMMLEGGNTMYRMTGNAPDAPMKTVEQRYIIRDYYRGNVEYSSRSLDYFYDMLGQAGKTAAGLKQMKEERDPRYKDEREKNRELIKARRDLNRVSKRLTKISKRMKNIYGSEDMSPEQKYEDLQRLTKQRNELTRKAMEEHWNVFY